jgi:hypothetical protein
MAAVEWRRVLGVKVIGEEKKEKKRTTPRVSFRHFTRLKPQSPIVGQ